MVTAQQLETLVQNQGNAPEPGHPVSIDGEAPVPMTPLELKSAGYTYIYDTKTGERSLTNNNMLVMQLGKKRPDGTPYFTTTDPGIRPKVGQIKCLLHPDNPDRKTYDRMGLPVCRKSNLVNEWQLQRHMEKRHRAEFDAIKKMEADREREEDRLFRQSMIQIVTQKASQGSKEEAEPNANTCPQCGKVCRDAFGLSSHMRMHKE